MTFKIVVSPNGIAAEFEVGSLSEAIGILQENENTLTRLMSIQVGGGGVAGTGEKEATESNGRGRRGRPPKNPPDQAPAAAPVAAPPPAPVPAAEPGIVPPGFVQLVDTTPNPKTGIPAFLDRSGDIPAPAPVPVPAAPPPPTPAPAVPPVGVLAPKVEAELRRRGVDAVSQKGLVDWLANPATGALVIANSTFEEACQCIKFMSDDKLRPVAAALQIG